MPLRYEKLGRWKEALRGYNRRLHEAEADGASLEPLNALRQSTGADDYSRPRGGGWCCAGAGVLLACRFLISLRVDLRAW